jgi:hypothetical protein
LLLLLLLLLRMGRRVRDRRLHDRRTTFAFGASGSSRGWFLLVNGIVGVSAGVVPAWFAFDAWTALPRAAIRLIRRLCLCLHGQVRLLMLMLPCRHPRRPCDLRLSRPLPLSLYTSSSLPLGRDTRVTHPAPPLFRDGAGGDPEAGGVAPTRADVACNGKAVVDSELAYAPDLLGGVGVVG